jgi:hypothetical protein
MRGGKAVGEERDRVNDALCGVLRKLLKFRRRRSMGVVVEGGFQALPRLRRQSLSVAIWQRNQSSVHAL